MRGLSAVERSRLLIEEQDCVGVQKRVGTVLTVVVRPRDPEPLVWAAD